MPLSREQQAQIVAMFGKSRGRFALSARQQQLLVEECVKQERTAAELPSFPEVVPEAVPEELTEEWNDLAKDAGMGPSSPT